MEPKYLFTYLIEGLAVGILKTLAGADEGGRVPEGQGPLGRVWFVLILILTLLVCAPLWVGCWIIQKVSEGLQWAMYSLPGTGLVVGILGAWWIRREAVRNLVGHGRFENMTMLIAIAIGTGFLVWVFLAFAWQTGSRIIRTNGLVLAACLLLVTVMLLFGAQSFYSMPADRTAVALR
jgi:hypothetical protein